MKTVMWKYKSENTLFYINPILLNVQGKHTNKKQREIKETK